MRVLFRALFQEGRDIGDFGTLIELAAKADIEAPDAEAYLRGPERTGDIHAAHQRAERLGVRGVPVFVIDREQAIAGAQPPEVLAGMFDVALAARQPSAAE